MGGDEFILLLPETPAPAGLFVMRKIQKSLAEATRARGSLATVSIGLVTFVQAPRSVEELVSLADNQMYAAKHGGKNRIVQTLWGEPGAVAVPEGQIAEQ